MSSEQQPPQRPQPAARPPKAAVPLPQPQPQGAPPGGGYNPPPNFQPRPTQRGGGGGGTAVAVVLGMVALVVLLLCGGVGAIGYIAMGRIRTAAQEVQRAQMENLRAIEEQNRRAQEAFRQAQEQAQRPRPTPSAPNSPTTNSRPPRPTPAPPPPPETPEQKQARYLQWLSAASSLQVTEAINWFASQPVSKDEAERKQVAAALGNVVKDGRSPQASQLLAALAVWGDGANAPAVLTLAEHHRELAPKAIALVGEWQDPDSLDGLVSLLVKRPEHGSHLQPVLVVYGEAAQEKLVPLMNHPMTNVRDHARAVLATLETPSEILAAQAIADTSAESPTQRHAAVKWLTEATELSEEQTAAKVAALGACLADDDRSVKEAALAAVLADESPGSTEILLSLLAKQEHGWNKVLEALLARGEMRAAEPLGALVSEPRSMGQALQAIRTTSGPGEDVVLHLITTSKDEQLIYHTIFALGKSGTDKSLKVLAQLARKYQSNMGMMIAINHAAKEIQQREGLK